MEDTSVVDHIVLLKLADPSDTSNLCSAIKTLTGLSGVKSITCAPTFVASGGPDRTAGYNFALVVRLDSVANLDAYSVAQAHLDVKKNYILPALAKADVPVLAVDFVSPRALGVASSSNKASANQWKVACLGWFGVAAFLYLRPLLRKK